MQFQRFFYPSSDLTRQVVAKVGQRRSARLRSAISETSEAGESDELLNSVLSALAQDESRSVEDDWEDRRWLSEIIYHFMGRLAGHSRRRAEVSFNLEDSIVQGMRSRLGLHEAGDAELLRQLAWEFSTWLKEEQGCEYIAGWGKIVCDRYDSDRLMFKPLKMRAGYAVGGGAVAEPVTNRDTAETASASAVEAELDAVEG
jgi:hypothetical protein